MRWLFWASRKALKYRTTDFIQIYIYMQVKIPQTKKCWPQKLMDIINTEMCQFILKVLVWQIAWRVYMLFISHIHSIPDVLLLIHFKTFWVFLFFVFSLTVFNFPHQYQNLYIYQQIKFGRHVSATIYRFEQSYITYKSEIVSQ